MNRITVQSLLLLVACLVLPLFIGGVGSFFTFESITDWYSTLVKPWFSPPNWVFGPAWTVLYIMMGISLWLVIKNGISEPEVRQSVVIFGAQLFVNLLWSIIFFGMRSPVGGLVTILILLMLIALTIRSFRLVSPHAAYLLIPYFCWTCFATMLNAAVVILNSP